jgi:AcrR family transcriptional regulator
VVPTDPSTPTRRRRRRSRRADATGAAESTRIHILKSAACLFRRFGYHGATVEQIAADLRMRKGHLYYYFKNKEAILFACHSYSQARLMDVLAEVEQSDRTPNEKVRALIVASVQMIVDELHGTALFLPLEALSPQHLRTIVAERDRFDRGVRRIIEEGIACGAFAPCDVKLRSFALLGAVNWIPRWFSAEGPLTSIDVAERFADYLIAGLQGLETGRVPVPSL